MRSVGRVCEWDDDRGYGFVVPHDGGVRAFVHVKAFPFGSRRPVNGDLVSYETAPDAKGRIKAVNVRFAGQRAAPPPRHRKEGLSRRLPRRTLGVLVLFAVAASAALGAVPPVVALGYGLMSLASFLAYWWDKDAAGAKARRTPEDTLHLLDLLGGWPGALVAQRQFRHKTVKASFQAVFWITVALNVAGVAFFVHQGWAQALTAMLLAE